LLGVVHLDLDRPERVATLETYDGAPRRARLQVASANESSIDDEGPVRKEPARVGADAGELRRPKSQQATTLRELAACVEGGVGHASRS